MSFSENLKEKWENFKYDLGVVYQFTVLNDATYETVKKFKMTFRKFLLLIILPIFVAIGLTTSIIFFTPIRELIPGYSDVDLRTKQANLLNQASALEKRIAEQDSFIKSLTSIAESGKGKTATNPANPTTQAQPATGNPTTQIEETPASNQTASVPTVQASNLLLRGDKSFQFIKPVEGFLTNAFRPNDNHFAIDLAAPQNSSIKSIADGFVFFSDYTTETGHVIGIIHSNNFISFYKHNRILYKKVGSYVFAGETIAMIGNSGENSTGPHLHFELWHNGKPIDPALFMTYKNY